MLRALTHQKQYTLTTWRYSFIQKLKCWSCEHVHDPKKVFCQTCRTIQPIHPESDFFSYFGLKRRFNIDETSLKDNFLKLQTHVHPDKYGSASDKERQLSEQHSSYLNRAYKTLRSPRERARYLLHLLTEKQEDDSNVPADIAVEMFEYIEEVEQETDPAKLQAKADHIDTEIEQLLIQIENSFEKEDTARARDSLVRLRFLDRARKILEAKLGESQV